MNISVRGLDENDAELYREVRLEGLRLHPEAFGADYEVRKERPLSHFAQRICQTPDQMTMGAFLDDELVGVAGLARSEGRKQRHRAMVYGMYVRASARGKGLGKMLLHCLLDVARDMGGVEQVTLSVSAGNEAAKHLYLSLGFEQYGVDPGALKIAGELLDEEWMILRLETPDRAIKDLWARYKVWLEAHHPQGAACLHPGAGEEEIRAVEEIIGMSLPEDLVASLRIHNGSSEYIVEGGEFLSTHRMSDEWIVWKDLLDRGDFDGVRSRPAYAEIKNDWWNAGWIPFSYNGSGDHFCVDLDPSEGGRRGQVISMWHDDPSRSIQAFSFTEWFSRLVDRLERGELVYDEDYGTIVDRRDVF